MANNQTLEPLKTSTSHCFLKLLVYSTVSKLYKIDYNSSIILCSLLASTKFKNHLPKHYKSVSICQSFFKLFFPYIGFILEAIWGAFGPLVAPKTSNGSGDLALLLRLLILFNLETYFQSGFRFLTAPTLAPSPRPARLLS